MYATAFVSPAFARLPDDNETELLAGLRTFGEDARALGGWLNTHEYLVKVFRKFRSDIGALTRMSREVVGPVEGTGLLTFVERYNGVSHLGPAMRVVFSDRDAHRLAALRRAARHRAASVHAGRPRHDQRQSQVERACAVAIAHHDDVAGARRVGELERVGARGERHARQRHRTAEGQVGEPRGMAK